MKKQNKILFAAQDPGGFNALANVIKIAEKRGADVKVFLANESCLIAKKNKINFLDCGNFSDEELEVTFDKFNPRVVVTSTSFGFSLDKEILKLAKKRGIPAISLVDFWANYKIRFSNPEKEDLAYLPNIICVIDEYMKKGMIKEGFEAKKLRVVGNPFFDEFKKVKNIRGGYLLFVSQPFSEMNPSYFNEVKILRDFVKTVEKLKINFPLVIGFHPREKNKDKFNSIILEAKIKIKISRKNGDDLVDDAKMVLGINSMAIFRAAIKGKKVVSYQPGIRKEKDVLVSNLLKLSEAVYDFNKLEETINNLLKKEGNQKNLGKIRKKYVENNSTQRVINLIEKFI